MYTNAVLSTHLFLPKKELKKPLDELRSLFTIRGRFQDTEPLRIYKETDSFFGIPRHYKDLSSFIQNLEDRRALGLPVDFSFKSELRERQKPVVDSFLHALAKNKTGFLLIAPTGTGKTVVALKFLESIKRTTLVVVPREYIVKQWIERIIEHTDIKREEIGIAQQNKVEFEGKKIVVGMIHSLAKDKYPKEFKNYFGCILYDEAHVLSAQTFSKTLGMFPAKYRIALTATPKRQDGLEDAFYLSIAEEILELKGGTDVVPRVFIKTYSSGKKPPSLSYLTDKLSRRGVIISFLSEDLKRNNLIAVYAEKFARSGRKTLILSDRKEQLKTLHTLLSWKLGVDPRKIGFFVQETPQSERSQILENSLIILATYGMMAMAVDVPDLAGLVFATPLSEITQSVGRILRYQEDKKPPVVLDIIDETFKETKAWAKKRKDTYATMGAQVSFLVG